MNHVEKGHYYEQEAADQYLLKHKVSEEQLCRFDVVAFLKERPILYKNAFEYQGAKGW